MGGRGSRVDVLSLVAGLVILALGTVLLLDRVEVLDLDFGYLWPALLGALGAILLAAGLTGPGGRR
jgi:hypothetical protein